jgi:hypothetical protein
VDGTTIEIGGTSKGFDREGDREDVSSLNGIK